MFLRTTRLVPAAAVFLAVPAWSTTRPVPSQYATIQAALDASASGDTVLVAPGTYSDIQTVGLRTSAAFLLDGVVLRSEGGPSVTSIDMAGQGVGLPQVSALYGEQLTSGATVVEGFTITGAPIGAFGVFVVDSEKVTFRNCIVRDMDGGATGSAGIVGRYGAIDAIDCEFRDLVGDGLGVRDADVLIDGCLFMNCSGRAVNLSGQDVGVQEQAVVRNSTFVGNETDASGGAANIQNFQLGVTIENCNFIDNTAVSSGGALLLIAYPGAPYLIQDCLFWNNRCTGGGAAGGAVSTGGTGSILGSTFHANQAFSGLGGGTAILGGGVVNFWNNVVSSSSTTAAVRSSGATMVVGCNVYWANTGGNTVGFSMALTSRDVNPYYCDPASGDFTVVADSPCLPPSSLGCGQIGAFGSGCGPISIETMSWGALKGAYR